MVERCFARDPRDADGSPSLAAPRRSWQTVAKAETLQQTLLSIH
jgi:hypothetical protein